MSHSLCLLANKKKANIIGDLATSIVYCDTSVKLTVVTNGRNCTLCKLHGELLPEFIRSQILKSDLHWKSEQIVYSSVSNSKATKFVEE